LLAHDWPGNVRELRNVIDRAMILEPSDWITPESLQLNQYAAGGGGDCDGEAFPDDPPLNVTNPTDPTDGAEPAAIPRAIAPRRDFSLETAEREFITRALKETGWQRTKAAALLGITRATLHAKLKRYEIQPPNTGLLAEADEYEPASA
jgi:DNA-binding NtrC family response regulator